MFKYFRDYYWKAGKPYGRDIIDPACQPVSYKIVVDPYYKRFSIEKYHTIHFDKVVYDSLLLDFRHLTQEHQLAWQREVLSEDNQQSICLLRNQEDRVILKETLCFEGHYCRSCQTHSVHGVPLALHRMYYKSLQDPFDGVVLYDNEERPVMMKTYETDPITGEFTTLLSEEWNMQNRLSCCAGKFKKSSLAMFEEKGLLGCFEDPSDLSTNYKNAFITKISDFRLE